MFNGLTVLIQIIKYKANSQKLVSIEIYLSMDLTCVHLRIGKPDYSFNMLLNQDLQYSWISIRSINLEDATSSIILGESTVDHHNKTYKALDFEDLVTLSNKTVTSTMRYKAAYFFNKFGYDAGGIAFPHKFIDEQYSLIHRLKAESQIDHLAYSIVFTDESHGWFILGGIPSSIIENKQSGSCKVSIDNDKWGCNLRQVYFTNSKVTDDTVVVVNNNNRYNNINQAYFNVKKIIVNAPLDFINYMIDNIFRVYLDKKYCEYSKETTDNRINYIICNTTILDALPLITFAFETMNVSLPLKKLFKYQPKLSKLLIYNYNEYGDKWVFGHSFLTIFHSLFDYDNHSITLYADKELFETNEHSEIKANDEAKWWCYLVVLCLMLFGLLFLSSIKRYNINNQNQTISHSK